MLTTESYYNQKGLISNNNISRLLIMAYLLCSFFIPVTRYAGYLLLLIAFGISLYYAQSTRVSRLDILLLSVVAICLALSFFYSDYSQNYTISRFGCLLIIYFFSDEHNVQEITNGERAFDYFYIFLVAISFVGIYSFYLHPVYDDDGYFFEVIGDKNYTAVFIFCVFMYAYKRKYLSGYLLTFIYASAFTQSRSFLLLLVLFFAIKMLPDRITAFFHKHRIHLFIVFFILFVAVAVFSVVWVYNISSQGVGDYKASLNDGSNRMRFVANIKAFQMLSETKHTLLWGYGGELTKFLGIDGEVESLHPQFMGVRLVQPHNSLICLLVKMGIVPGLIYWWFLAKLLEKYNTKENMAYLYPFALNAMFMHSLFEMQWLVLWIYILSMPERKRRVFQNVVFRW